MGAVGFHMTFEADGDDPTPLLQLFVPFWYGDCALGDTLSFWLEGNSGEGDVLRGMG